MLELFMYMSLPKSTYVIVVHDIMNIRSGAYGELSPLSIESTKHLFRFCQCLQLCYMFSKTAPVPGWYQVLYCKLQYVYNLS